MFDILTIQETKIDRTYPNSQFQVENYKLYRNDRIKGGGGIIVYVRDNIAAVRKRKSGESLECILLDVYMNNRRIAILCAYKPPSVDNATFSKELSAMLDEALSFSDTVICTGDLNSDILHPQADKKEGRCLLDVCDVYDLDSIINVPTRISKTRESCLDVILTNASALIKSSGVLEPGLSDHKLAYAVLNSKLLLPKADMVMKRSMKQFNQEAFIEDLSKVPFSTAYVFDDPEDVYWCWEKLYNQILDDHAPIISFKKSKTPGSQFITVDIRKVMRQRDRLKRKFNKSRSPDDWENYRKTRNKVVSMRRRAVKEHFAKLCEETYGNQRKFWTTISPYINSRKNVNTGRIILKDNGKIIKEQNKVAETLNAYFTGFGANSANYTSTTDIDLSHIAVDSTLSLRKSNPIEVYEVLKGLKPNKATGHDLIPPELVQQSAEALSQPFSTLFNYILDHATVPSQWKLGEISPVHKKDCNLTKSNYRPYQNITDVGPYFEDLYHKLVFAYRKGHGCDTALLSLTEQWRKELDNRKIVGLVSMDLSKAFDMLPHSLIIQKLAKYGADDNTLSLIKDYLTDRKQRVKLAGTFSPWLPVQRGIPQGSILGPLLFNIFINDLPHVIDFTILSTYADDTQIFYAGDNVTDVEHAINSDLGKIDKWYEENEMRRNHDKYKAMVMGKTSRDPVFKCEGTSIPLVEEMELLGVTVDNKLKFEGQIKKICRKVSQQIAVLKRMKKLLPLKLRENLYRAFIAPHFNYCAESWHFCGNRLTEKLEKLNERALRFVYQDKNSPYETLIVKNGYSTLANQRLAKILSTVFRAIGNGNVPSSISELLTVRISNYNLRGDAILK